MTTNRPPAAAPTKPIGVVLAGGKSSRMGRDKATLALAGEPLLLRARNALLAAGCDRILLSGGPRPNWPDATVADLTPDAGPVGGIISAIQHVATDSATPATLLFIPVDAPLLSPDLLRTMLDQTHANDGCTIAESPLPVALRTTDAVLNQCASTLPDLRAGASRSIRRFLQPLQLAHLAQSATVEPLLINVNTPAEWERLRHEFENRL